MLSTQQVRVEEFKTFFQSILNKGKPSDLSISESSGWSWEEEKKGKVGWTYPNKVWVGRIAKPKIEYDKLNKRWAQ